MARTDKTLILFDRALGLLEAKKLRLKWVGEAITEAEQSGDDAKLEDIILHLDAVSIPHNF